MDPTDRCSISYSATDGTARLGTDYDAPSGNGALTWAAGDTTNQTFTIPIFDDGILDGDKSFSLNLSGISLAGALGTPATATVNILEIGGLSFGAANYNVNEGDGTVTVTLQRLFDSSGAVSVHYSTADGTATSPDDYTATSGTFNWTDGDSADKSFTVPIIDDSLSEGNEKFSLILSAASGNAELGPQVTATVTIAKSDGATIDGTDKKPQAIINDSVGDLVTLKLLGKVGTITYFENNGVGLSEIDLSGTDSTKSSMSIVVKKPREAPVMVKSPLAKLMAAA